MALNIRDAETHALARKVADVTGESMTQAVKTALRERLERVGPGAVDAAERQRRIEAMEDFARKFQAAEIVDPRSPDEILGYDEHGLPS
jgi:antitoxin VapB